MFTRILVPFDFSAPSEAALALARGLARVFGASIHLLHVVEDQFVTGVLGTVTYVPHTAGTQALLIERARAGLAAELSDDDRRSLRATSAVIVGTAARTIVDYAADSGFDLIVMGTHGRSGVAHLVVGSVAEQVVRTAHCPVMTVRDAPGPVALPVPAKELTQKA